MCGKGDNRDEEEDEVQEEEEAEEVGRKQRRRGRKMKNGQWQWQRGSNVSLQCVTEMETLGMWLPNLGPYTVESGPFFFSSYILSNVPCTG